MKTTILLRTAAVAIALLLGSTASAYSSYYGTSCQSCHGAVSTCAGCHAHGVHSSSAKADINLTGTTDKTSYTAGEAVIVTIDGGYRSGWVRAILFDQSGAELIRSTGDFPITLSAPAPSVGGTYTWQVAWYGNDYDAAGASFGPAGAWTANPNNANHGFQTVATNAFTVTTVVVQQPIISVTPTSLAFGTVTIGNTAAQSATVSNTGTADLAVESVARCATTSAEFAVSPTGPFSVAPGSSQTLTVTYAPVDATTDSGCIQIVSNDPTSATVQVNVSGTGQSVPTSDLVDVDIKRFAVRKRVDFSRGLSATPKVSVVNSGTVEGTATVTVEGSVTDALGTTSIVYTASQDVTLAPAANARLTFPSYSPTAPLAINWTATVADQDPDLDLATATTKVVP